MSDMKRTTAYYVDWRDVIINPIPCIDGDPKWNNQRRIVEYGYHLAAVADAREQGQRDALAEADKRLDEMVYLGLISHKSKLAFLEGLAISTGRPAMEHDKLCPVYISPPQHQCDYCHLIARVRADERKRAVQRAKDAMPPCSCGWHHERRRAVIAAIRREASA